MLQLWWQAMRPRTLVLAIAGTGLGLLLAAAHGEFWWLTAVLTVLTAVLLQVLSNLANDYGDSRHGVDSKGRVGPTRAVQSGRVTLSVMLRAVALSAVLAAAAGLFLVRLALGPAGWILIGVFLVLGALAVWAAIAYTATARPYGYWGLGDLMVFVFFGPVAVLGSYFLQAHALDAWSILPAAAAGLLAVGVLNINNLRDLEGDRAAGKLTVPVRLGLRRGRIYHTGLVGGALLLGLLAAVLDWRSGWQLLFLLVLPLFAAHVRTVWQRNGADLDPLLRQMALGALAFSLLFGIGNLLAGQSPV